MKHEKFRHIKLRVIKVFGRSFFAINETLKRQKANFEYFANHRVYLDEATMPDNTEVDKVRNFFFRLYFTDDLNVVVEESPVAFYELPVIFFFLTIYPKMLSLL